MEATFDTSNSIWPRGTAPRTLLVVVAMESEEKALLEGMSYKAIPLGKLGRETVREFDLPRCRVLVGRSGIGIANAAVLLAAVAEDFKLDAVLLLGVGGALDPMLQIGDVV